MQCAVRTEQPWAVGRLESLMRTNRVGFGELTETEKEMEQAEIEPRKNLGVPDYFNVGVSYVKPSKLHSSSTPATTPPPMQDQQKEKQDHHD
jgi:hypothetical protein